MNNAQWAERKVKATPNGVGVRYQIYAERGENAELWDVEGRRYIDFYSGVSVNNVGHRHPKVVAAIEAQLKKFIHTGYQIVPYGQYIELAEKISARVKGSHAKKTAFFTVGVEAVENAIKIARAYTRRGAVIAFTGAFHGRSLLGLALTGKVAPYKLGFGPLPAQVYHCAFPSPALGVSVEDSLAGLTQLFKCDVTPTDVAAIIIEPVQGEGGFYQTPPELMHALRKICDEHGIVLIADEIQTGFGRTGKFFAMEHYDVTPDITTFAKSVAGGVPLSGLCGRAEIMDSVGYGGLGGTYAGNVLAVAAAHAVLDIIDEEKLCERAVDLGEMVRDSLKKLADETEEIGYVRALGSMVAVEFVDPTTGEPNPDFTRRVHAHTLKEGLLILVCGLNNNVIRFLHPLTTPDSIMREGLRMFTAAVRAASSEAVADSKKTNTRAAAT